MDKTISAKKKFDELGIKKLPNIKSINKEYAELSDKKTKHIPSIAH